MDEEWREIPGFPGYEASNLGRIRSWNVRRQSLAPLIMKPRLSNGYVRIGLRRGEKKQYSRYVHVLVLEAFVGLRPNEMECRHLDNNRENNKLSNLAWGTRAENDEDKRIAGTGIRGEHHKLAKLTERDVVAIRKLSSIGFTQRQIAKKYGVCKSTVGYALRQETWAHVE